MSSVSKFVKFPIPLGMFPNILFFSRLKKMRVVEKLAMYLGNSPPKLLSLICKILRCVEFVNEKRKFKSFSLPFPSLLSNMTRTESLFNFSKEGTFPLNLFSPSWSNHRFEALDIEIGIGPVNWLALMLKILIFCRVIPMSNGRCPWIWLRPTSKFCKEDKLKIEGGIVPDNLFETTEKSVSFVNWPKEVGILPPKLLKATFLERISCRKKVGCVLSNYLFEKKQIGVLTECQELQGFPHPKGCDRN